MVLACTVDSVGKSKFKDSSSLLGNMGKEVMVEAIGKDLLSDSPVGKGKDGHIELARNFFKGGKADIVSIVEMVSEILLISFLGDIILPDTNAGQEVTIELQRIWSCPSFVVGLLLG